MNTPHTPPRPQLVFDGFGINGPDEYRTRIATFSNDAKKYGPLFAAAPELLEALRAAVNDIELLLPLAQSGEAYLTDRGAKETRSHIALYRAAIAAATGRGDK